MAYAVFIDRNVVMWSMTVLKIQEVYENNSIAKFNKLVLC